MPDIRTYMVDLARYEGFRSSKPLPGTKEVMTGDSEVQDGRRGFYGSETKSVKGSMKNDESSVSG